MEDRQQSGGKKRNELLFNPIHPKEPQVSEAVAQKCLPGNGEKQEKPNKNTVGTEEERQNGSEWEGISHEWKLWGFGSSNSASEPDQLMLKCCIDTLLTCSVMS